MAARGKANGRAPSALGRDRQPQAEYCRRLSGSAAGVGERRREFRGCSSPFWRAAVPVFEPPVFEPPVLEPATGLALWSSLILD
ncbi:MAG TPA: hypothetical protein VFE65_22455 [Pseudonocardia sp.]|nr:hypothetical protein [Pseudonocardia sp.]